MEHQKNDKFVSTPNKSSKFRTKYCGMYDKGNQIEFKNLIVNSSLCNYSNINMLVYTLVSIAFKNYAPFIDCINEANNTQTDNAKDTHVVMSMYNLIAYNDNYSKTSGSLWKYYRNEPALTSAGAANNCAGYSA